MQGRVEQPDGHRQIVHRLEDAEEVGALVREQLGQGGLAAGHVVGEDHLADRHDALGFGAEEHVLGAAQADALGAEVARHGGVVGGVGVGADAHGAELVGPAHDLLVALVQVGRGGIELAAEDLDDLRRLHVHRVEVDFAVEPVDGDGVPLLEHPVADGHRARVVVDAQLAGTGDAGHAHAAGDHRRVAGHATAGGQDALGHGHAADVLGAGLDAGEDDLVALLDPGLGGVRIEHQLATGAARRGVEAGGQQPAGVAGLGLGLGLEDRGEQLGQLGGLDLGQGLGRIELALVHQVRGDADGREDGALAVAGLQHPQLAVLDGELHVLHVAVAVLELGPDLVQLHVGAGHDLLQRRHVRVTALGAVDQLGGADAGHHVLALGVAQELAVEDVVAVARVAGEGHAGGAVVAEVAEDHGLHVDRGAPVLGDVVLLAVAHGARDVPRREHGLDGAHELIPGVLGERPAQGVEDVLLEPGGQALPVLGGQLGVVRDPLGVLDLLDHLLGGLAVHAHDHIAVHGDEPAVAVPGEPLVTRGLDQALDGLVVEADVEHRVHHAGHGHARAGTHGHQQGVARVAERAAHQALHAAQVELDLLGQLGRELAAELVELGADLGGDGEAGGDGQTDVGHLAQVGALATQQVLLFGLAFGLVAAEVVHTLDGHDILRCSKPSRA